MSVFGRMRDAVLSAVWAHLPCLILGAVFFLASLIFLDATDEQIAFNTNGLVSNLLNQLPYFFGCLGIVGLIWLAQMPRPNRTVGNLWRWLAGKNWVEIILLRIPIALLFTWIISYLHLYFKVNIPNFAPYTWDHYFAGLDRLIFFGQDPWMISHRVFPDVLATQIFDTLYLTWFLVMQMSIFAVALLPPRNTLRLTFLLAYGLNWVVAGALLAILLPAAGPVYMEPITGDPMFRPLMDQLHHQAETTKIVALEAQKWLWEGYTLPEVDPVGISAFPSLHLTIATTCACLGFTTGRVAGWLGTAFTIGMLIGSVHLGWHYAIDGFAGIVLALVFWRISTRVTRWWLTRTEPGIAGEAAIVVS